MKEYLKKIFKIYWKTQVALLAGIIIISIFSFVTGWMLGAFSGYGMGILLLEGFLHLYIVIVLIIDLIKFIIKNKK